MTSHPKHAASDHEILDVIRRRWSPRAFDATRPVTRAELLRLFEAARWAPSSMNEQPWRFIVAEREATPEGFQALLGALTGKNPSWAASAPVLALVAVRKTFENLDATNESAWYDAGQAVALLVMQATAMELSVRQMEGFDRARAREALAIPEPFEPAIAMAIGYAGDPEALVHEKHRAAERKPRTRKALGEIVFDGAWGVPLGQKTNGRT
jgi:nitroreductase